MTGPVSVTAQLSNTNVIAATSFMVHSSGGWSGGPSGIGPPVVTTTTLPNGTVGQPYSEFLQANGLEQGDAWSLASGSVLPQGLTLGANGVISGVPSVAGNSSFAVRVTSSVYGSSTPQSMGIDIQPSPASGGGSTIPAPASGGGSSTIPAPASGGGSTIAGHPATATYSAQTLATQDVSIAGADLVYHGGDVTYHLLAPSGSLAPGSLITLEKPGAGVIQAVQNQLAGRTAALLYFGVEYSAQGPSAPSTLMVTDSNIPVGARVYKVASDGTLIPVKATVAQGQIRMPTYETSNFVVTVPILQGKSTIPGSNERIIDWRGERTIVPTLVKYHTTYIPVHDLTSLLQSLGIQSTWNGHVWNLSSTASADLSNIRMGTGDASIYLNKTLVQKMNVVIQTDPLTNRPATYMPIWYVMQLLKRVGIHSSWNGKTWTVT